MMKTDRPALGSLVDVRVNEGRGISLAHLMAWHDEDHAVIVFHGVGGDLDKKPHVIIPISDIVEVF